MSSSNSGQPQIFVDTWGWLVLEDRRAPEHKAANGLRRSRVAAGTVLVTSDFVLDEMTTRLFSRRPFAEAKRFTDAVFAAEKAAVVTIESINRNRLEEAYRLRMRYRDKPRISFTDLTSFVVMLERNIKEVMTGDDHFVQTGLGFEKIP